MNRGRRPIGKNAGVFCSKSHEIHGASSSDAPWPSQVVTLRRWGWLIQTLEPQPVFFNCPLLPISWSPCFEPKYPVSCLFQFSQCLLAISGKGNDLHGMRGSKMGGGCHKDCLSKQENGVNKKTPRCKLRSCPLPTWQTTERRRRMTSSRAMTHTTHASTAAALNHHCQTANGWPP